MAQRMSARSGVCSRCQGRYTNVISLESIEDDNAQPSNAPFTCPRCGHASTIRGAPGERIVSIETKPYPEYA